MLSQRGRERLVDEIVRVSLESNTLSDFCGGVLPHLSKLVDASGTLLYRITPEGETHPVGGSLLCTTNDYMEEYMENDPIREGLALRSPRIQRVQHLPEWDRYVQQPVYNEYCRPHNIDDFFHIILQGNRFCEPGMVAIMLSRAPNQAEFDESDGTFLARVYPALEALARRNVAAEEKLQSYPLVESIIDLKVPAAVAMDVNGSLLWASELAYSLLQFKGPDKNKLPPVLATAARRLGNLLRKKSPGEGMPTQVVIPQEKEPPIWAELRIAYTRTEEPFILAELDSVEPSPQLCEVAERHKLTRAETETLRYISLGFSDREIAEKLCISATTVRTHVGRILSKLQVNSRIRAALTAHGLSTFGHHKH